MASRFFPWVPLSECYNGRRRRGIFGKRCESLRQARSISETDAADVKDMQLSLLGPGLVRVAVQMDSERVQRDAKGVVQIGLTGKTPWRDDCV